MSKLKNAKDATEFNIELADELDQCVVIMNFLTDTIEQILTKYVEEETEDSPYTDTPAGIINIMTWLTDRIKTVSESISAHLKESK